MLLIGITIALYEVVLNNGLKGWYGFNSWDSILIIEGELRDCPCTGKEGHFNAGKREEDFYQCGFLFRHHISISIGRRNTIMSNAYTPSKINITGIVTAMEWDADDNVVSVRISTQDEEEYIVGDNSLSDELLGLLYEPVKVTGILHENEMGKKAILVESYELLDEDEFLFDK